MNNMVKDTIKGAVLGVMGVIGVQTAIKRMPITTKHKIEWEEKAKLIIYTLTKDLDDGNDEYNRIWSEVWERIEMDGDSVYKLSQEEVIGRIVFSSM
jgi:hypothetical protein